MKEKLPINLRILKWARTSYNLSLDQVAKKISKTADIINDWEEGNSSPTYIQLETLAVKVYHRPLALFFFPDIPHDVDPKADFRSVPNDFIDNLPPEILKQYRNVKVLQVNLSELFDNNKPNETSILDKFRLSHKTDLQSLVNDIRIFLKIDYNDQVGWHDNDSALKNWRHALETNGIFIFKDAFKNDNYSGFCLFDRKFPIIMLNNSTPKSRQIFTIFHELAHLLIKSGGIDYIDKEIFNRGKTFSDIEVKCNQFAGEFLLPSSWFLREKHIISEKHIIILANKYSVSREVILRKYLDFKFINERMYNQYIEKWYKDFPNSSSQAGGDYYYTKKAYLGDYYVNLSFQKYYQGRISIEKLAEYLSLSVKNVSNFEQKAFGLGS